MIIINKNKSNYNADKTSILCLACKPGYKPTMDSYITYAIQNCQKIPFCVSSTRFNGCSLCE